VIVTAPKPAGPDAPDVPQPMRAVLDRHGFGREKLRIELTFLGTYPVYPPPDVLASSMRAIVKSAPDVILAWGAVIAHHVARETSTIPIVFFQTSDAVTGTLVDQLRRPGRNVTGVMLLREELYEKRLEIVRDLLKG